MTVVHIRRNGHYSFTWKQTSSYVKWFFYIWMCLLNPQVWPFKWKLWAAFSAGAVYYAVQGVLAFELEDEILQCDHSSESYMYWTVLNRSPVYCIIQGYSTNWVCGWNSHVNFIQWKLLNSTFLFAVQVGPNLRVCLWNPKAEIGLSFEGHS